MRDCEVFRGFVIGEGDVLASIPPHGMVKGRWVYGSYLCTKGAAEVETHCIWGLYHGPDGKIVAKITLGRCTGAFDSKYATVYEGDILKCEDEQSIMVVKWEEKGAYFGLDYMYNKGKETRMASPFPPFGNLLKSGKFFVVIGNQVTPMKELCVHFPDYKP